jgi:RND family efflux transporter MFP subunit
MSGACVPARSRGCACTARAICAALVAALACGCGNGDGAEASASEADADARASVLVETATIARGRVAEAVSAVGQVEYDPTRVRTISFPQAGQVVDVRVVPGERVQKGGCLARLGPVPSGSLDTQRARVEIEYARRDLERVRRLRAENLATNADVQSAEKVLAASSTELKNLGGDSGHGMRELRAPADGVIAQVQVTPGSLVQSGQIAFTLAPPDALVVRVGFDPEDAARLRPGLPVELQPLFARGASEPISAQLTGLQSAIDSATQRVEALIRIPDSAAPLYAGERLRVSVAAASAEQALVVPHAALTEREGEEGVFVVEGERAHWRPFAVGLRGEEEVEARSGLEPGDVVVIAGHSSLEDDTEVRVETADVASPGSAAGDEPEAAHEPE